MNSEEWELISEEAKDFLTKVILKDPTSRISAEEALAHPWLSSI